MTTKHSNVLVISPDYKFKKAINRCSLQKKQKIHSRKITSILQYRAYDKQRLLEQIDNKLMQKNNAISQNKQLKAQIQKIVSQSTSKKQYMRKTANQKSMNGTATTISKICSLNTTLSNARIYSTLISLKEENEMLTKQIQKKNDEIIKIKRSQQYCQFKEVLADCLVFKEEICRLKAILKDRRKKKIEIRRQKTKIRNQKICQILNQKRGIQFLAGHSAQLKENLDTILQQIAHLKSRNKQMGKTKKRLLEDIQNVRVKTKIDQLQISIQKNQRIVYNPTKKTQLKSTSPATILQLQQQQNQNSGSRKVNNKRQESMHKYKYKSHQKYEDEDDDEDEDEDDDDDEDDDKDDDEDKDSIGSEQQAKSQPQSGVRDQEIDSF